MYRKPKKFLSIILALTVLLSISIATTPSVSAAETNILMAPTGVEVYSVTQTSISLRWQSVEGATAYKIFRSKFGYNDYKQVGNSATTEFIDSTVEGDTTYLYKILAADTNGDGSESAEVLGMTAWSFPNLASKIDISKAGTGNRMRIGDLNGDGRYDILMVQPAYESRDAYNPRYVGCLTAYDIEGNLLWQVGSVDKRVTTSGADEPVQIYDIDDDGFNEVLSVMNLGNGKKFIILDGKTGQLKKEYTLPNDRAHDAIFIANFSGNRIPQDILLKDRYSNIWAMDKDFKLLWYYPGKTGHSLLPFDFNGDGKDELVNNYSLIGPDGKEIWRKDHPDHVDTHWVADINNDGQYEIILGGSDTFCYSYSGELLWTNNATVEPQQILVGEYRIDYPGMELAGLDRLNRGNPGQDGMFLFSSEGKTIYQEKRAKGDWGTIVRPLDNWTGTYSPLITAYRRGKDADNPGGVVPKLYDGFFNPIVTFNQHTDAKEQVMVADMCGDARDELIIYNLTGDLSAYIYTNGPTDLKEHITGVTRMSDFRNYNFSRYDSRVYELTIKNKIPSGIKASTNNQANIDVSWIPVLGATSYNIYRAAAANGEYVKVGSSVLPEFTDKTAPMGTSYYKVTAASNEGESKLPIVSAKATIVFSGILPPVKTDRGYTAKAGSTIPLKFQLKFEDGKYITGASAKAYISGSDSVSSSAATIDNLFRYDTDENQYIFNLNTKTLQAGTYQIKIDVADRTISTFDVILK